MNKIALILLAGTLAAGGAAGYAWKKGQELEQQNGGLRSKVEELEQRLAALQTQAKERSSASRNETQRQLSELERLRNEAAQLRSTRQASETLVAENETLRTENQQLQQAVALASAAAEAPTGSGDVQQFPRESWNFAGYGTPESALISAVWAMKEGQPQTYLESLAPQEQQRMAQVWQEKSEQEIAAKHQQDVAAITGVQILERHSVTPQEMIMKVHLDGLGRTEKVRVNQVENEWKFGGFVRE